MTADADVASTPPLATLARVALAWSAPEAFLTATFFVAPEISTITDFVFNADVPAGFGDVITVQGHLAGGTWILSAFCVAYVAFVLRAVH